MKRTGTASALEPGCRSCATKSSWLAKLTWTAAQTCLLESTLHVVDVSAGTPVPQRARRACCSAGRRASGSNWAALSAKVQGRGGRRVLRAVAGTCGHTWALVGTSHRTGNIHDWPCLNIVTMLTLLRNLDDLAKTARKGVASRPLIRTNALRSILVQLHVALFSRQWLGSLDVLQRWTRLRSGEPQC